MASETSYPYVLEAEGQSACLRRTPRVRIAQIAMDYLAHGWSAEEMCRHHPHLTRAEAHAALLYYWDHQAQIDEEIRQEWQRAEREANETELPAVVLRLMASSARVA